MMRERYEHQLGRLHEEMTAMCASCEQVVSLAMQMLTAQQPELLQKVTEVDAGIDRREREIESLCLKLLLEQQPVATDLRDISAALKMISDLERIGDQAVDIADLAGYLQGKVIHEEEDLKQMAGEAIHMVNESIEAFLCRDLHRARAVIAYDDVVDGWFDRIREELIARIAADPQEGAGCIDLLMIAKYLERIADHATNVAEWVEYTITGRRSKNGVFPEA